MSSEITAGFSADMTLLPLSAYGVRVNVEASCSLERFLPSPLLPGARVSSEGRPQSVFTLRERSAGDRALYEATENGINPFLTSDISSAVCTLRSCVEKFVAASARRVVFVHAGVAGWRGRAILLPGISFSGKSTLIMALLEAGATYYSDEYAVIDADGLVHAFDREPQLRPDVSDFFSEQRRRVLCESRKPRVPLPLGMVLRTAYRTSGEWNPRAMTQGEMLLTLIENTVGVRSQPEFTVRTLNRALRLACGFQSPRGESPEAADRILKLTNELHNTTQ